MCFSKWSMHFFLKCMCFTRKGMCSSTMNNVPNGTTLYYLAGISTALHIHSLMTMSTASARRHTSAPVTLRCWCMCAWTLQAWETQKWGRRGRESFCRWKCSLNEQETGDFSSPALLQPRGRKNNTAKYSWDFTASHRQSSFRILQLNITWVKDEIL